jgi:hypothetical protein
MSLIRTVALGNCLALLPACGSTTDESGPGTSVCEVSACPADCDGLVLDECDVRQSDCQARIFRSVACVRGGTAPMPPTTVISEAEYQAQLDQEASQSTPDDPVATAAFESAFQHYRLLPEGTTIEQAGSDLLGEVVGGYYSSDTREVYVVDRAGAPAGWQSMLTLGHEYVHAVQDQEVSLQDVGADLTTTDAQFATFTLFEGEARLYEFLVMAFMFDVTLEDLELERWIAMDLKENRAQALESDAAILAATFGLRYPLGAEYLYGLWREGGNAAVRVQYDTHPITSLGWMRGPEADPIPEEPPTCAAPAPAGFESVDTDTLGAVGLFALRGHSLSTDVVLPAETAWVRAQEWRGDQLRVYRDPASGAVAAAWAFRFSSDAEAAAFAAEAGSFTVITADREVLVLVADQPALLEPWATAIQTACP